MSTSADKFRALIVDDEPLARQLVARLLRDEAGIEICGTAASGRQAVAAISELRPDVVFIDIRMPDLSGIGVIRGASPDSAPLFVIVTAFESHAVEAFEVRAFDYILKPIEKARFKRAVGDARAAILNRRVLAAMDETQRAAIADERSDVGDRDFLRLRAGERVIVARFDDVRYFEACNQYVRVHVGDTSYLLSTESLASLQARTHPESFFRIHRSYLVNGRFVSAVVANGGGGTSVVLSDGRRIQVARRSGEVAERILLSLAKRLNA